jgi:acetoin utilization deacetylase AcuC-like enzyme
MSKVLLKTLILHHDDCLAHNPGARHPEASQRLQAVLAAVRDVPGTELLPAPLATREQVERVHDPAYLQQLVAAEPEQGCVPLDPDTFLSPGSVNAALRGWRWGFA